MYFSIRLRKTFIVFALDWYIVTSFDSTIFDTCIIEDCSDKKKSIAIAKIELEIIDVKNIFKFASFLIDDKLFVKSVVAV